MSGRRGARIGSRTSQRPGRKMGNAGDERWAQVKGDSRFAFLDVGLLVSAGEGEELVVEVIRHCESGISAGA